MNYLKPLLPILLMPLLTSGQIKKFTARQLEDDLSVLVKTVEAVHPNPYHAISKENFYKLTDSIKKNFRNDMTAADTWPLFARLMASYNEGHASLEFPAELKQMIQKDSIRIFPLFTREFDGENFVCRYDFSGDSLVATGDLISSINGISSKAIMQYLGSFFGGLTNWKNLRVLGDFASLLQINNIQALFTIDIISGGVKKTITHAGVLFSEYQACAADARKRNAIAAVQSAFYSFTRTPENAGYINFRSMKDLPAFNQFLDSVFTGIKNIPVDGLIIDLRQNGGGSSSLAQSLIGYISDKPYRLGGGSMWKVSDEYKSFIIGQAKVNAAYTSGSFKEYQNKKTGEIISQLEGKTYTPRNNKLRYEGKICVLIGPNTFSSANMLANAIKDYKLATLIGEPTGEAPNDFGELYWNKLPNTGLTFYTCTKQFIRANGDTSDSNPIFPDIEIKQNSKSLKDDVLEFAKEWLKKK